MKKKYYYFIHGLHIESEIKIDAVECEFKKADVFIEIGKVPLEIEDCIIDNPYIKASKTKCIEYVKNIANYYSEDGNRIIIEPALGADETWVSLFLEGRGLTAILNQRNLLTLHGSGVMIENKGVLILGDSGAGKSSLATGLLNCGYNLITDDLIGLYEMNGRLLTHMGIPVQRLGKELIIKFEIENKVTGAVEYPGVRREKFYVNRHTKIRKEPIEIHSIFYIKKHKKEIEFIQLKGIEKIDVLLKNLYREDFMTMFNSHEMNFKKIVDLASNTTMFTLKREDGKDTIDEQIKLIVESII
ncbi:MAG: hypothetical protein JEZ08_17960 [Clostridiales bacterium]|nr:hypothetical protein [Clostridiales bacterium]